MMLYVSLLFSLSAYAVPTTLSQQGRLLDVSGNPIQGSQNLTFRIFESPSATNPLWTEGLSIFFENGYYQVVLGSDISNPLDIDLFEQDPLYLELQLNSENPFLPRSKVQSLPYAQIAKKAESVSGGPVNATQIEISGNVVIDSSGSWIGPTINVGWANITNIPAGFADGIDNDTFLSESEVENFVVNGALDLAAGTTIDGKALQEAISCQEGEILRWDGQIQMWLCDEDLVLTSEDVLGYVEQNPIDLAASSTLDGELFVTQQSTPCNDGQILIYNLSSEQWLCGEDQDTDTQLTADDIVSLLNTKTLSLGSGTSVNGSSVLTENSSLDWNNIANVPSDITDGDANTQLSESEVENFVVNGALNLAAGTTIDGNIVVSSPPSCTDGQILSFQGATSTWTCIDFASVIDQDGDGILAWNDCNDLDDTQRAKIDDTDCDTILATIDCNDEDPAITNTNENDADCDTIPTNEDCDDSDPVSTIKSEDADCDGILTDDDCDDSDSLSTIKSEDADCDSVLTSNDCDDNNADIQNSGTGDSEDCAAISCKEILDNGHNDGNGVYWIDPTGSNAFQIYCDMTTDSGGWTLVLKYDKNQASDSSYAIDKNGLRFDKSVSHLTTRNTSQGALSAFVNIRPFISNGATELMHTSMEVNDTSYRQVFYSDIYRTVQANPDLIWNSANDSDTMNGSVLDWTTSSGSTDKTRWYDSNKNVLAADMQGGNYPFYAELDSNTWSASMFSTYNREGDVYCSITSTTPTGHQAPHVNWGWVDEDGSQQSYGTAPGFELKVGTYCATPSYTSSNSGSCRPQHRLNLMWVR